MEGQTYYGYKKGGRILFQELSEETKDSEPDSFYEELLLGMVKTNSHTSNRIGVQKVSEVFASCLEEIGFKVNWHENSDGVDKSAPLMIAVVFSACP
ncbi:hypothetical protein M901_0536 [Bacteriovorax sp. DB6_IX]|nr:hypothetical protein M901_0536 [Bacteriovorax sp. DB6_IX]